METQVPLGPRQKAFRRGDGLADNVWILRSLIRDRTRKSKPLSVAFVDVAKAFDSVSHESIILAARRMGVPQHLLCYLRTLYTGSTTRLKVAGKLGERIRVTRVRQGDPLSPILFNLVMDWVLASLDPALGVQLRSGVVLNHLAFADDGSP